MKTQLSQGPFYGIIHSFPCRRQSKKSIVFSPNRDRSISWPDSSWDNVTVKRMARPAPTHHSHSSETQGSVCPHPPWAESSQRMSSPKALPRTGRELFTDSWKGGREFLSFEVTCLPRNSCRRKVLQDHKPASRCFRAHSATRSDHLLDSAQVREIDRISPQITWLVWEIYAPAVLSIAEMSGSL